MRYFRLAAISQDDLAQLLRVLVSAGEAELGIRLICGGGDDPVEEGEEPVDTANRTVMLAPGMRLNTRR